MDSEQGGAQPTIDVTLTNLSDAAASGIFAIQTLTVDGTEVAETSYSSILDLVADGGNAAESHDAPVVEDGYYRIVITAAMSAEAAPDADADADADQDSEAYSGDEWLTGTQLFIHVENGETIAIPWGKWHRDSGADRLGGPLDESLFPIGDAQVWQ